MENPDFFPFTHQLQFEVVGNFGLEVLAGVEEESIASQRMPGAGIVDLSSG
jgi:hypothetical protein